MSTPPASPAIGIYGSDASANVPSRGFTPWPPGYAGAVSAVGGTLVQLTAPGPRRGWESVLARVDGAILAGAPGLAEAEFCECCRERRLPLLAVGAGMHVLNTTFGGTLYLDLPRDRPEALQHRHPPEVGLRHAITVTAGTRLGHLYGDGEIVVNSEHRRAVDRVARGFRVSATALDGIIEGIELDGDEWFAVGIQWQPASVTASGLDIQLFRGLLDACSRVRVRKPTRRAKARAAA